MLTAHDHVKFIEFGDNGEENEREGWKWADGPRVGASWSTWVLADSVSLSAPLAVAVVAVTRRHRVGLLRNGRWTAKGGRYVDIGEMYTETAKRSPTGRLALAVVDIRTGIAVRPLDATIFRALSGLCSRCGAPLVDGGPDCGGHGERGTLRLDNE